MKLMQKMHRIFIYYCNSRVHALFFPYIAIKYPDYTSSIPTEASGYLDCHQLVTVISDCTQQKNKGNGDDFS